MYTAHEVRALRHDFWTDKARAHELLSPVSLVSPADDPTVLFNVAGMQQLVPYLSWKDHPQWCRLYNIQPCLRTNDIEDIGDERHLSMFEMMGNRSLGDYFKQEALTRSVEFLVEVLGLDKDRLGCSVFGGYTDHDGQELISYDHEAADILLSLGISQERIKAIPMIAWEKCDNFRWPAGAVGPCGPCAEFHYDRGDDWWPNDWDIGANDRFIEIWNNVFMEFYKHHDGSFTKLSQQNVDTGMWFERLMMVLQEKETVFETDVFGGFMTAVEDFSGVSYPAYHKPQAWFSIQENALVQSYRIVADHVRASEKLIEDGVVPSNDARWYVLRRLIRRSYLHFVRLSVSLDQVLTLVDHQDIWRNELLQFEKTLTRGQKYLEKLLNQSSGDVIAGADAFLLSDTYGFPLELTQELALERGYTVDVDGYEQALADARVKAQQDAKRTFSRGVDWAQYLDGVPPTLFFGYDALDVVDPQIIKQIVLDDGRLVMIFDKTPFYAESGGQTGDRGVIVFDDGSTKTITDVKKYNDVFLHFVE